MKFKFLQKVLYQKIRSILILAFIFLLASFFYSRFAPKNIRYRLPLLSKFLVFSVFEKNTIESIESSNKNKSRHFINPRIVEENEMMEFPAVVEPSKEIFIQSKQPGRIKKIHVEEGQSVKIGQLLLELDDELIRLEGDRLQINLIAAKSQEVITREKWEHAKKQIEVKVREIDKKTEWVELAKKEYDYASDLKSKKEILWKQGYISSPEYEKLKLEEETKLTQFKNLIRERESLLSMVSVPSDPNRISFDEKLKEWKNQNTVLERAEYELSLSNIKIIQNQIKANEQLKNDSKLYAPSSGKILKLSVKEGEVTSHIPLMSLMEKNEISVSFHVGERELKEIQLKKEVQYFPSISNQTIAIGILEKMNGYLDPKSHGIMIKAKLIKHYQSLLPGMFGIVKISSSAKKEKILVPTRSLFGDYNSGFYLHLKSETGIEKRFVQIKTYSETESEVIAGLGPLDAFEIQPL
ncbi:biotin-lipoyl-like domain protein [Leptospira yanagawae serovar Saopaulo str. Sao Paulo = ATCC 700523]|uniref:Biotin-lipoyl-like domain protein n=2 Tax=Leptospira yanagawae TaxID=293069 RepID=A0A5E8HAK2_9LEPT|nr:biotin-lipoyl-like domain protein [Leptospira yanagawae serovar Saopaulo str. Sao Paulo = ATCC 700523]